MGETPLTGDAVKVTELPAQIAPAGFAVIVTLEGRFGFTVMFLTAEAGEHVPPVEVSVRVAAPVNEAGGVQVALTVLAFGENEPPTAPSSQVKDVASPKLVPPRATFVLPWQMVMGLGPTLTHCDSALLTNNDKTNIKTKVILFISGNFLFCMILQLIQIKRCCNQFMFF